MKSLRRILQDIEPIFVDGNLDLEVSGIAYDSRKVKPGNVFVCILGMATDGHKYINQALNNGAVALVIQSEVEYPKEVTVVRVSDSRLALAKVAAAFYDYPAEKLNLLGVTGTNGKTTITYLLAAVFRKSDKKTGLIGTIHNLIDNKVVPSEHTTPESSDLQLLLSQMTENGVSDVVMEVSSHALSLGRIDTLRFQGAIFTNLTQDHLDFHKTMDSYYEAKLKLFTEYQHVDRINVLNIDDIYGRKLMETAVGKKISYGIKNEAADFRAKNIELTRNGLSYEVCFNGQCLKLKLKLLGEFNVYNSLAVFTYSVAAGIEPNIVKEALEQAGGVPGRFEIIDCGQPFSVAVDYAHTPDGLENILSSARKLTTAKLITVFGCGGDRDRTKRPKMGAVAAELSDIAIVTSDNPRSEVPEAIIKDIFTGIASDAHAEIHQETNRHQAIIKAIALAKPNDIVIIAGKGHETYQIIKEQVLNFDDREEARLALRGLGYGN